MSDNLLSQINRLNAEHKSKPPVHLWNPDRVYDFDLRIDREGRWIHEGGEIKRKQLVKLFASILKKDDDDFYLVTPVEKARIDVEDVPFIILEMEVQGGGIVFRDNLDEVFELGPEHPVELRKSELGELPYIKVRDDLWARFNRNVYYQAVELAEENDGALYLSSKEHRYLIGRL